MAIQDSRSQRLFIDAPMRAAAELALDEAQSHYLVNVLRAKAGAALLAFNGRDGEWSATLAEVKKRSAILILEKQARPQVDGPDLFYVFAPLKRTRLDYMVQKATELGVAALQPVITQHTISERVNLERMRANAIEAAEQCGVLRVPDIRAPIDFGSLLAGWEAARAMIFCDEGKAGGNPIEDLRRLAPGPLAVLIGPEGGFSPKEREALLSKPFVTGVSLGPRVMRADTAAVAALALVNATLGDWR